MKERIKLLVADGNEIFRRGLASVLSGQEEIELIGIASTSKEALDLAGETHPDIVLVGAGSQEVNEVQVIRNLQKRFSRTRCIVFTEYDTPNSEGIFESIRAGAYGYLLRTVKPDQLLEGIRAVYRGGTLLSPEHATRILKRFNEITRNRNTRDSQVSPREREILKLMSEGLSNKQIAYHLRISTKTVKTHVAHIMKKLKAKNRTEAVVTSIRKEYIDLNQEIEQEA
jgi:DNA-binding NarL/FixJ family response regulator